MQQIFSAESSLVALMLTLPCKYFSLDVEKTNSTQETRMGRTLDNMVGFLDFKRDYFPRNTVFKKDFDVHSMVVSVEANR